MVFLPLTRRFGWMFPFLSSLGSPFTFKESEVFRRGTVSLESRLFPVNACPILSVDPLVAVS